MAVAQGPDGRVEERAKRGAAKKGNFHSRGELSANCSTVLEESLAGISCGPRHRRLGGHRVFAPESGSSRGQETLRGSIFN
jgi:hypothetical protein